MSIRPGHHDNSLNSLEGVTCTASHRCKKCNQLVNVSRSKHHHVDQMEDAESRQPPRSIEHGKRKKNTGSGTCTDSNFEKQMTRPVSLLFPAALRQTKTLQSSAVCQP